MKMRLWKLGVFIALTFGISLLLSPCSYGQDTFITLHDGTKAKVTTTTNDLNTLAEIEAGQRADFATLALGASVVSFSSRLNDPVQCNVCADVRDVIGGSFSRYFSGEEGNFIFDRYDTNQFIVIDLGQVRQIDQVGAHFSELTSDREVYDFFEVQTSEDGVTFTSVGVVGIKGSADDLDYTLDSPIFFTFDRLIDAQFVKYNFGKYSPDWRGGSRVIEVFATAVAIEDCTNGIDDDRDGLVDCDDPDCSCDLSCVQPTETSCANGIDDDCDGLVDCADPDCFTNPDCTTPTTGG